MTRDRVTPTLTMSEDDLLRLILDAANLFGWLSFHIRNSKRGVVQGDVGFPDLVLVRKGVVFFVELKAEKGRVTPAQQAWLTELRSRAIVVRPADVDRFLNELRVAA